MLSLRLLYVLDVLKQGTKMRCAGILCLATLMDLLSQVLEVVQQEMDGLMVIARSIEDGQSRLGNKYISMAMELDQQQQTASTIQLTFSELASSANDVHF